MLFWASGSGLGLEVAIAMGKPAFFSARSRGSVPGQAGIFEYKACRRLCNWGTYNMLSAEFQSGAPP